MEGAGGGVGVGVASASVHVTLSGGSRAPTFGKNNNTLRREVCILLRMKTCSQL